MKKILLVLALALAVVACGKEYNGNASIVSHEYDDPDTVWNPGYTIFGSCSGGYGSTPRTCQPDIQIPGHWSTDPERFLLHVEWTDEDGKHHVDVRSVPRTAYDDCEDGRTINLKSMQCPLQ